MYVCGYGRPRFSVITRSKKTRKNVYIYLDNTLVWTRSFSQFISHNFFPSQSSMFSFRKFISSDRSQALFTPGVFKFNTSYIPLPSTSVFPSHVMKPQLQKKMENRKKRKKRKKTKEERAQRKEAQANNMKKVPQ